MSSRASTGNEPPPKTHPNPTAPNKPSVTPPKAAAASGQTQQQPVTQPEKPTLSFMEEVRRALSLYTLVINIFSLADIDKGWEIFGDLENLEVEKEGRLVAVVGFFKTGKTWFTSKFLSVDLHHSLTVPTIGLSLITPKNATITTNPSMEKPKKENELRISGFEDIDTVIEEEKVLQGWSVMDTPGSERPSSTIKRQDKRATDWFLRDIILETTSRLIYVTDKMDSKCQDEIESLRSQLRAHGKEVTEIKKLIVVHNHREVEDVDTLNRRIGEVKAVYDISTTEEDIDGNWKAVRSGDAVYFRCKYTMHFFFVKDVETPWNKKHNDAMMAALKSILEQDDAIKINLVREVMNKANLLLDNYLENWNHELKVDKVKDRAFIKPVPKEGTDNNNGSKPLRLHKLIFGETGAVAATRITLEGAVKYDAKNKKLLICVRVPGLTADQRESVEIKPFPDRDKLIIEAPIPKSDTSGEWRELYSSYKFGTGKFVMQLPKGDTLRYKMPNEFYDLYSKQMQINNGELMLTLDAEDCRDFYR